MLAQVSTIRPLLKGSILHPSIQGTESPGMYWWWFREDCLPLLGVPRATRSRLRKRVFDGTDYYALYCGIAVNESIRKRLNWHINQIHKVSNIKSGHISTLRHTIGALLPLPESIEKSGTIVNDFIDEYCIVEWRPYNLANVENIHQDEIKELTSLEYWYPLNIRDNKQRNEYTNKLKERRSNYKKTLIENK